MPAKKSNKRGVMIKKIFLCLMLASMASFPLLGSQASTLENDHIARVNWSINFNAGFFPCYCGPYYNPYFNPYFYPYPAPCPYPPPPYWVW